MSERAEAAFAGQMELAPPKLAALLNEAKRRWGQSAAAKAPG